MNGMEEMLARADYRDASRSRVSALAGNRAAVDRGRGMQLRMAQTGLGNLGKRSNWLMQLGSVDMRSNVLQLAPMTSHRQVHTFSLCSIAARARRSV